MMSDLHEGDEPMAEQLTAFSKKELADQEFIKAAVEQTRLDALVEQAVANPAAR